MATIQEFIARWEWLLLVAVAAIELLILRKVREERRERDILIGEMKATRVELGRESYLAMIKETLGGAKRCVYFVSHTLTLNMVVAEKQALFDLYKTSRDHRCITGPDSGKIREMWEQARMGVKVRVNDLVMRSTFRYQVCDASVAVLGFADEGDDASRKGMRIENVYFAKILEDHFLRTWEASTPFLDFVVEIIARANGPELSFSLADLAEQWALTEDERTSLSQACGQEISQSRATHAEA
jgi:hypothetical protein